MDNMSETMIIKTSWDEVNLDEYLKICKVEVNQKLKNLGVKKSLKMAAIISNKTEKDIGQMNHDMFAILLEKVSFIFNTDPNPATRKPFKIKNKDYIFHPNFDKLTAGEMVSIETIIKDALKEERTFLPEILAVLIRPAITVKNEEAGTEIHGIEPFYVEGIVKVRGRAVNILEYRKGLFMKHLLVPHFLSRITAFMDGANRSKIIMNLSAVRKNQLALKAKELNLLLEDKSL